MDFDEVFGGDPDQGANEMDDDLFMFSGMNQEEIEAMKEMKDSVIFLIDCHKSMYAQNIFNGQPADDTHSTSSIDCVLRVALSFMKTKIITSDNDKISVVLYGCAKTDNSLNLPNICVMQRLDTPDAATIKSFQLKIETFESEFGFAPKASRSPLFEALWSCHQEFKSVEKQSFNKRIFLFTDEDCPGTENDQLMAQQRANDLAELNVDIELFPMPKPQGHSDEESKNGEYAAPVFDVRKFYANIISYDEDQQFTELLGIEGAQSRIFELMKRIRQKEFKKRTIGKCMFNVSPGSQIALSFFSSIIPAKKPGIQRVNAVNQKQLRSTMRFVCSETGETLYR